MLKCRLIDKKKYVIADLSIECSGSEYNALQAFAIFCVLFWACGLPLISFALLRPVRSELRQLKKGDQLPGFQQHLKDFYAPYKPAYWYFEVVEYAKKLLLIGIIPAIQSNVVGTVIAMLLVNVHLILLLKMEPTFPGCVFERFALHCNFDFGVVENGCSAFIGADGRRV